MSSLDHEPDLRRAPEATLLQALTTRNPLALAEAYHRTVPAAHGVARRLLSGSDRVENLLLSVYTRLWEEPPVDVPLEGWVRRTTWQEGSAVLRDRGEAPASPSTAGQLPDLPAPDVRFLDAAERAIAELDDHERQVLLTAHDSGVDSSEQGSGAAEALTRALLALAGPETAPGDREALDDDGCDDLSGLGDWGLGIASPEEAARIEEAIRSRPGCAAKSRAVRRGRRRIEGLPATADMGQRILVRVLTAIPAAAAPPAGVSTPPPPPAPLEEPVVTTSPEFDEEEEVEDVETITGIGRSGTDSALTDTDTADLPPIGVGPEDADLDADEDVPGLDDTAQVDPIDVDDIHPDSPPADTALESDAASQAEDSDWRPDPGSTAELRLSDILAEGEEDDPFADMDDLDDERASAVSGTDPYAALQDLDDAAEPAPRPRLAPLADDVDGAVVDGYVEGQDDLVAPPPRRSSPLADVLAWVLPILGGSIIGITFAIVIFGLPS